VAGGSERAGAVRARGVRRAGRLRRPHLSATLRRLGAALAALALVYPLVGFLAPIGPWQWDAQTRQDTFGAARVSLGLTALALAIVVAVGTPLARYLRDAPPRERLLWQGALLLSILLPPLALGILLTLAFGPHGPAGAALGLLGFRFGNTPATFVITQMYVAAGYYVLAALAAFDAVPRALERHAALLGDGPARVFWRISLPLARRGLAVGFALAWVRALGEFGAVVVTAYYPAGMPVQLWIGLESVGLPAVMPLLVVFLVTALPLPWFAQMLAARPVRDPVA